MKKNILLTVFSLVLLSCGGDKKNSTEALIEKGDLKELRLKRSEIITEADVLSKELKKIDDAISTLDVNHKETLITTFEAKESVFKHYLELQAAVETKENIVVNAEFGGILTQINVKEGQRVTKGQALGKIDDGGLTQQLAQLEIQAVLAKTTFDRQKNLWDQKIGSEIQFLQAKSTYEAQNKAVLQLKKQMAKTVIKAPFSGIVDEIITEKGSVVGPGSPLLRVISLGNMYLEAEVPEKYIGSIKRGTEVIVDFPMLNETINTTISLVNNNINPGNRSFKVQIQVPNKSGLIKPNLSSKININDYSNLNVITVPLSIISENADGEQYIYIAEKTGKDNQAIAKKVIVKTGKSQGDLIEILEGLNDGDSIIKEGARSIKDGQKVSIIK
ncbi:efflux RND transporter periplasmic adaptor subunit [Flavobacterium sp. K5-23]|uniref:efflux RND transporter periplasmic adaptor subunit n=1 Tax=Flavobacterium sp. K5-23 TaxID=2746225 RepID=UPI00200E9661|nr:efflux RND transporter periplasmic adaptor subunit [Flavobacterium sp. K5-23]UQD55766.1 efflux RND transporter periplasmic adaptor subunit [Flavobacterium sp. K5-23]